MPTFLAYPIVNFLSSISFKFRTSTFVAGVGETYLTQSFPFSVNSIGGNIEFKQSSALCWEDGTFKEASWFFVTGYFDTDVDTNIGVSYFTSDS